MFTTTMPNKQTMARGNQPKGLGVSHACKAQEDRAATHSIKKRYVKVGCVCVCVGTRWQG